MNHIRPIAVALILFCSTACHASMVLNWAFTRPDGISGGNGTFTVRDWDDTLDGNFTDYLTYIEFNTGVTYPTSPVPYTRSDFLVVTDLSGWILNKAVSFVAKDQGNPGNNVTTTGFQGNDNVVLNPRAGNVRAQEGYFTPFGVSFLDSDSTYWNLFVPSNNGPYQLINSLDVDPVTGVYNPTSVTFTIQNSQPAAIPIPAAAWLMLSGLGSFFFAGRRHSSPANAA
jgi:hypothetical protein